MRGSWEVKSAVASTRGGLHVRGINHDATDPLNKEFSWEINHHGLRSDRFDFSGCEFAAGALERLKLLQRLAAK